MNSKNLNKLKTIPNLTLWLEDKRQSKTKQNEVEIYTQKTSIENNIAHKFDDNHTINIQNDLTLLKHSPAHLFNDQGWILW